MKIQLVAIIVLLCAFQFANAQTEKGKQILGLYLNYGHSKNINDITTYSSGQHTTNETVNIGPSYGYFIADNLELGGSLIYSYQGEDYNDGSELNHQRNNGYGVNLHLRKYFLYNHKLGFSTGGNIGYEHDTQKSLSQNIGTFGDGSITTYSSKGNTYSAGLSLALVYFPSPKLGVTASLANLNYNHNKMTESDGSNNKNDMLNFSFTGNSLGISIFYVFGGK